MAEARADADVFGKLLAKFGGDRAALLTYLQLYHQQLIQEELSQVTLSVIAPRQTWEMIGARPPVGDKDKK